MYHSNQSLSIFFKKSHFHDMTHIKQYWTIVIHTILCPHRVLCVLPPTFGKDQWSHWILGNTLPPVTHFSHNCSHCKFPTHKLVLLDDMAEADTCLHHHILNHCKCNVTGQLEALGGSAQSCIYMLEEVPVSFWMPGRDACHPAHPVSKANHTPSHGRLWDFWVSTIIQWYHLVPPMLVLLSECSCFSLPL